MKVTMSVPGKWHFFHISRELIKRGLLHKTYTSLPAFKVIPAQNIPAEYLSCLPLGEYFAQVAKRLPFRRDNPVVTALQRAKFRTFDAQVAKRLEGGPGFVYHGLSSSQTRSLKKAKALGMKTILERASTHILFQNRIMREEYAVHGISLKDHQPKWQVEDELEEYRLADRILVPSRFVKQTFVQEGVDEKKVIVVPLPSNPQTPRLPKPDRKDKTFNILFLGEIGPRKGAYYVLEAARKLRRTHPDVRLILVGNITPEFRKVMARYEGTYEATGYVSYETLGNYYAMGDVFVFPSIEEGLAMCQAEAMQHELPLIATPNSGCEEIVTDGVEGFIVPLRDPDAIADRLSRLYEDRTLCRRMGQAARQRALGCTWERFVDGLTAEYRKLLEG